MMLLVVENWYEHVGLWLAAILTLAIFSFLYKDNPVYKLAEHIFVGVAAGYTVAISYWNVFVPNLYKKLEALYTGQVPEGERFWAAILHVPMLLGLFFFARFHPKVSWLSRWSIAFLVGMYAGVNMTGYFQGDLIVQTQATFVVLDPSTFAEQGWFNVIAVNLVILIGVLVSLTYFFFSTPHAGFVGISARAGIFFLMAAFGASFGYTVMARISLFIGRMQYIFWQWLFEYTGWPAPPIL